MFKRNSTPDRIEITEDAHTKILSWGMALDEIIFIAYGRDNVICNAIRLTNQDSRPRNYCDYSQKEFKSAIKKNRAEGCQSIYIGHSHPSYFHLRKPSKSDWTYLPKKYLQLIVLPFEMEIIAWKFKKSYSETVKSKILLKIITKSQ